METLAAAHGVKVLDRAEAALTLLLSPTPELLRPRAQTNFGGTPPDDCRSGNGAFTRQHVAGKTEMNCGSG